MPSATAALATAAVATAGNPNAGQRGKFLQIPRFRVRVLNPVTGAVVITNLPHIVLEYETIFPQLGMAGSSAVGHFVIHLYHPLTDEYAWAKVWYDQLDQLQRVEIYMVDDPDGAGATGDPVYTGIIVNLPKEDFSFRIEGEDSLKLLDLSRTLQSDTFTGSTDALVKYALKTYQLTKGDDWTGDLTAYTNNGSWVLTTDQGFKSVKSGFASDGLLVTTAIYGNNYYADCFIEAPYHLTCASGTGAVIEGGVVAAAADVNNLILGRANMRFVTGATATTPGRFEIDAEIWQKTAGSYAMKAQTKAVMVETTGNAQVTVTLQGVQTNPFQYTWRVLLNEIDSKCQWVQSLGSGSPTGGIGLRSNWAVGVGAGVVHHHLVFMSKFNAFQPGNIAAGAQQINQPIASQQNIDLLHLAASTEGNVWSKRPKPGLNQDQIDFGVSTGGDLSGMVRLEENIHVVAARTEANAEPFHNAVLAAGMPAYDSIGLHRWYDIATIKTRGLAMGSAVMPQTSDTFAMRQMAQNILLRRKQPTQAGRMTVLRHDDHAELPAQPKSTGLAYGVGDWVTQHEPRKGIYYKRVQIMSAKVTGGIPVMELTLDQYPVVTDREPLMDRMQRVVEAAQTRRGDGSIKDSVTGISRDTRLVLPLNPWKMRAYASAGQTYTAGLTTTVALDTITTPYGWDTANGFNTATFQYTIPVSGYYICFGTFNTVVTDKGAGLSYFARLRIFWNGVALSAGESWIAGGAGGILAKRTTTQEKFFFNAGDLIDLRALVNPMTGQASEVTGATSPVDNWMSIELIAG